MKIYEIENDGMENENNEYRKRMLRNRVEFFLAAILVTFIITCFIAVMFSQRPLKNTAVQINQENVQEQEQKQKKGQEQQSYYVLKKYGDKIGVFKNDTRRPYKILEVYFDTLPEQDQIELRSGVKAFNDEELAGLIEDFSS